MSIVSSGAGHGGKKTGSYWYDPGAGGFGYNEANFTREINEKILAITKAKDTTDNAGTSANSNLGNITAKINAGADGWALSNHLNAFNGTATGVEVLYGSPSSKAKAEELAAAIAKATGLPNRGAKDGSWLYLARNSYPGKKVLLIEWAFVDNKSDMDKLVKNLDKAIAAMLACFGYKDSSPSESKPTAGLKTGDTVKVTGNLYKDADGSGKSSKSRGKSGKIDKIAKGKKKPYHVNGLGWAAAADLNGSTSKPSSSKTKTVTIDKLNVYTSQSLSSPIVTTASGYRILKKGTKVKVTATANNGQSVHGSKNWSEIDSYGWVPSVYLK